MFIYIFRTYFAYIIGSKGATKKRLETETRTKIFIPKIGHMGDIGNFYKIIISNKV